MPLASNIWANVEDLRVWTLGVCRAAAPYIIKFAKDRDHHLRELERKIHDAELHKAFIHQRMQGHQSEYDFRSLLKEHSDNRDHLLELYKEHKAKADNMLFAVICGFGCMTASAVLSFLQQRHARAKLRQELQQSLGASLDALMEQKGCTNASSPEDDHEGQLGREIQVIREASAQEHGQVLEEVQLLRSDLACAQRVYLASLIGCMVSMSFVLGCATMCMRTR